MIKQYKHRMYSYGGFISISILHRKRFKNRKVWNAISDFIYMSTVAVCSTFIISFGGISFMSCAIFFTFSTFVIMCSTNSITCSSYIVMFCQNLITFGTFVNMCSSYSITCSSYSITFCGQSLFFCANFILFCAKFLAFCTFIKSGSYNITRSSSFTVCFVNFIMFSSFVIV